MLIVWLDASATRIHGEMTSGMLIVKLCCHCEMTKGIVLVKLSRSPWQHPGESCILQRVDTSVKNARPEYRAA